MQPKPDPTVRQSASSTFKFGYACTAAQLGAWVQTLPPQASVQADKYKGDQREPTETTFTATWEVPQ